MHAPLHVTGHMTEHCGDAAYATLAGYEQCGGYTAARSAIARMSPDDVVEAVRASGLKGRGGGQPVGPRWSVFSGLEGSPAVNVCNASESVPGTFKDAFILQRAPHLLIEGILIAAHAVGSRKTFVCVRNEYVEAAESISRAVGEARESGRVGNRALGRGRSHEIEVVRGAGAHICGEETALVESLEGRPARPRRRKLDDTPVVFGMPALVHSVETFCHLPHILARGPEWFQSLGTADSPGTTLFGVSGHVVRPGLFELASGVPDGRKVKAVVPGGLSTAALPAGQLDVGLADELLRDRGTGLGTGGVVVMDDTTCMVRAGCVVTRFFRDESCGQCTGCRKGTGWLHEVVARIERGDASDGDVQLLSDICESLAEHAICGFADGAAQPVQGLLRHFHSDFVGHTEGRGCRFDGSFEP